MGKIQERCCQGLSASAASQRAIVASEASVTARSMTSRCSSAREKRDSGTPCSRGRSHAIALTSATCCGGKTARAARALEIFKSVQAPLAKASSPAPNRLAAHPKPLADLGVGPALGGQQHEPGPLHLAVGARVAGGAVLELRPLVVTEHDLVGAASRHHPPVRRDCHNPFKRDGISDREH